MPLIVPEDLAPFATIADPKAQAMIDAVVFRASEWAPGIDADNFAKKGAAKAILVDVILRWNERGTGARQSQTIGPFAFTNDTRSAPRSLFTEDEIAELQALVATAEPDHVGPVYSFPPPARDLFGDL